MQFITEEIEQNGIAMLLKLVDGKPCVVMPNDVIMCIE